jgi:hypothetical protein
MYVESHDHFTQVGLFDADSGTLEIRARGESPELEGVLEGSFASLAGEVVVFYRKAANLYIGCGSNRWRADKSTTHWESDKGNSRFAIVQDGREVFSLTCRIDSPEPGDLTAFSEPEDWDFGRFIYNVVNDSSRARRIYQPEQM